MRVEIINPVMFRGEVKRSGIVEVPDSTGKHWVATGAAVVVETENPPAPAPAAAAERGQKRF